MSKRKNAPAEKAEEVQQDVQAEQAAEAPADEVPADEVPADAAPEVTATGRTEFASNNTVVEDNTEAGPADAYAGTPKATVTKLDSGTILTTFE